MPKSIHGSSNEVLLAAEGFALADSVANDSDNPAVRTFSGIANSGKPFYQWGDAYIVDLSDITFKDKIPALDSHDRDKRCGVATLTVNNNRLMVSGHLLSNPIGQAIADDADEGFPWELSVHVISDSWENLPPGASTIVNDQTLSGPITILRQNTIREVSFTPTGVDSNTSATVLSDGLPRLADTPKNQSKKPTENKNMTIEEALAKIAALEEEITELKKQLAEAKKAAKKAETDAKLSAAGFAPNADNTGFNKVSDAMYQALLSADSAACDAMIADLSKPTATTPPAPLPGSLLSETTPPAAAGQNAGAEPDELDKILADKGVY